jgi:hypothetical protein
MRNYEFGIFLKNRVFHKNANTPPLDEISEFRKNSNYSKSWKLDIYCKLTLVFVSSIGKTSKTSTTQDFFQKTHFSKISLKWNYLQKYEIYYPRYGNVIYYDKNSLIWKILNLGHFWKIEFFTKMPIPIPRRNFRISKTFKLLEIMKNSTDIVN